MECLQYTEKVSSVCGLASLPGRFLAIATDTFDISWIEARDGAKTHSGHVKDPMIKTYPTARHR